MDNSDAAVGVELLLGADQHPEPDQQWEVLADSAYQAVNSYSDAQAGRIPEHAPMVIAIPTGADNTQAPNGQDTLYLWENSMPLHTDSSWEAASTAATKTPVAEASAIYDGVDELEIGRFTESPDQFGDRLRVSDGSLWHVDQVLTRTGPLRPAIGFSGYRTPVPGLFLGGAGSHPTYGVTGVPRRNSAQEILRSRSRNH